MECTFCMAGVRGKQSICGSWGKKVAKEQQGMELTHRETDDLLRRILTAVDKDPRSHWVEVTCAIILSLATTGSAWCAYQSSRWNGVQNFRLVAASKAGRESSESTVLAMQGRAFDAAMFINYIEAKKGGNKDMEDFLHRRFRPEMRLAMDAWLKTDPFNNQNAPPTPFAMAEYVQMEQQKAKRQDDLAAAEEEA